MGLLTPEQFSRLTETIPDALLLVRQGGVVEGCSKSAAEALETDACTTPGENLGRYLSTQPESLESMLANAAKSRQTRILRATLHSNPSQQFRCHVTLLTPAESDRSAQFLIRLQGHREAVQNFTALNQKLRELNAEIVRRQASELVLREKVHLLAFGREIALALADAANFQIMLDRCCKIVLKYLDAAFVRIWSLEPGAEELILRASVGLYTHTDGPHGRIRIGQLKIGTIAESQQPHLTNNVLGDKRISDRTWARDSGMVAFAGYPLVVDKRTVGVLAAFAKHTFSEDTLATIGSVSNELALGMERKRVESILAQQTESLRQADRRKDEFLAMLAHELRNPLAPIRSGIELLAADNSADRQTLGLMQQQVDHLVTMVNDLLDVSRVMRGRIALEKRLLPLSEALNSAIESARPMLNAKQHELIVSLPDHEMWLMADPTRIAQVVTNVLNNAAKYTSRQGHVWLTITHEGERAVIEVRDDGIGIDPEFLPNLFELFTQAERGLDRAEGGLGVGLTVVRDLIQMHDGTIVAESDGRDRGSRFIITLPLVETPPAVSTAKIDDARSSQQPQHGTRLRVLIADDTQASAKILARIIDKQWAYEICLAHDGHAACQLAEEFNPDVILLDIGMPGLNGYDVARHLRAQEKFADTLIVAVTGYGKDSDREESAAAGIDSHLVKPVSVAQLAELFEGRQRSMQSRLQDRSSPGHAP